jgi:hypothetical protein
MDQAHFERERGMSSELWRLSASEVARLVRTRKVSAREVADAALQRLDSVNPRINAIVDCRPDLVREQADRVDSVLARGNDPGPLAGVPVTIKINIVGLGSGFRIDLFDVHSELLRLTAKVSSVNDRDLVPSRASAQME